MKRERDANKNSNSKTIIAVIIIVVIALAAIFILKSTKSPELAPIGSVNDDLIGKSLTIQAGDTTNELLLTIQHGFDTNTKKNIFTIQSDDNLKLKAFSTLIESTLTVLGPGTFNSAVVNTNLNVGGDTILKRSKVRSLSYEATPNDKFREVWGSVSATGTKTGGSAGWTVQKTSTGGYRVTLSPTFLNTPIVTLTSTQPNTPRIIILHSSTGSSFEVRTYNTAGNVIDTSFNFNVKGPA